ncbi:MAG: glycosyltransferase family 1 protein [Desulfobulbaceae bacterium]|nr:MAG: glycosyltransferase family 1 protein [Desulfobulbaceae bacterium]
MRSKKIAIVTDAWHPQINGVVTTLTQTINHLKLFGFDVKVITPLMYSHIPCPTYPEISLSLVSPRKIKKVLTSFCPDAIHIATEGPLGWSARRACMSMKRFFTTSYHTKFPEYVRVRAPIPLKVSYALLRRFHNSAHRTLVSTDQLQDDLLSRGFTRTALWSRGVDTDLFKPTEERVFEGDDPVFTYVGRVACEKNIESFLKLDLPGSKCVVGHGPAYANLKDRYPEVLFTGYKKGKDLVSYVASSNVLVFPSLTDTFGLVQIEALACGVPVAAYPVPGPLSIIKNGVNGWVDDDLGQAAIRCLDVKPDECRKSAMAYSWENSTRQFLNNLFFH